MRFHVAWDSLEKENRALKFLSVALLILALLLTVAVMSTASDAPLIVERGCHSKMMALSADSPNEEEMRRLTEEAVKARFNTKAENLNFLSIQSQAFREREQSELSKQKMKQTVVVNGVEVKKDGILVDSDRLISVGDIRSTFRFPLKVRLERATRSEANPYGLILSEVETLKEEVKR